MRSRSFAPRAWCQMSTQTPPFGRSGGFDDRQRVGGVDDVRERQELEADDRAVIGGTIAHVTESGCGVGDRSLVRPDRLDVSALERVDQFPHRRPRTRQYVVARCRRSPARRAPRSRRGTRRRRRASRGARSIVRPSSRSRMNCPANSPMPGEPGAAAARIRSSSGWLRSRLKWLNTRSSLPSDAWRDHRTSTPSVSRPASSARSWRSAGHESGSNSACSAMPSTSPINRSASTCCVVDVGHRREQLDQVAAVVAVRLALRGGERCVARRGAGQRDGDDPVDPRVVVGRQRTRRASPGALRRGRGRRVRTAGRCAARSTPAA